MTRDDIIRMAEEADFGNAGMECIGFGGSLCSISTIERFAALVAAAEREKMKSLQEENDRLKRAVTAMAMTHDKLKK